MKNGGILVLILNWTRRDAPVENDGIRETLFLIGMSVSTQFMTFTFSKSTHTYSLGRGIADRGLEEVPTVWPNSARVGGGCQNNLLRLKQSNGMAQEFKIMWDDVRPISMKCLICHFPLACILSKYNFNILPQYRLSWIWPHWVPTSEYSITGGLTPHKFCVLSFFSNFHKKCVVCAFTKPSGRKPRINKILGVGRCIPRIFLRRGHEARAKIHLSPKFRFLRLRPLHSGSKRKSQKLKKNKKAWKFCL